MTLTFPDTLPVFLPIKPLTLIDLSVLPPVDSESVGLAPAEITFIGVPVGVALEALAVSAVVLPRTLVNAAVLIDPDAKAFSSLFTKKLASVNGVFEFNDGEVW